MTRCITFKDLKDALPCNYNIKSFVSHQISWIIRPKGDNFIVIIVSEH
jgi:hypothetical protein